MNGLEVYAASPWYLTLKKLCAGIKPEASAFRARQICHAPLTKGTLPVSAGAAVITPQRRFRRAPQGSPQVFRRP